MKKKLLPMLLIMVLLIGTSFVVFASNAYNETERQLERLHELSDLLISGADISLASHREYGAYIAMPQLNLIAPPPYEGGNFIIGVYIDIGDLGFNDRDEIAALASESVPDEISDFILDFTGIRSENADIGFAVVLHAPLLPCDFVPSGICPVWGDERSNPHYGLSLDRMLVYPRGCAGRR